MTIDDRSGKEIIIGSRGSDLALWQAHYAKSQLEALGYSVSITIIKTQGDQIQNLGFDKLEGKGFFTKELEDALLAGDIDMAVHSMKDLPTKAPEGLVIGGVSYREDPRDVLIVRPQAHQDHGVLGIRSDAVVGTSSNRRKAQAMHLCSAWQLKDIRGNVPTRIQKLRDGLYDAIFLAKAGLNRLDLQLEELKVIDLHVREFVPAPAQGVLAYQVREEDIVMRKILLNLHNQNVAQCTNVERKVLQQLQGGCHLPLGVHVYRDANGFYQSHTAYAPSLDATLKVVHYPSSTTAGMADYILEQIQAQ